MKNAPEKYRIKDIAKLAGVSEGTVDRVLHNRGNVSPKSRVKVEEALAQVDYRPNVYASALAQKKKIHLVCITPIYNDDDYWQYVSFGIRKAYDELSMMNVYVEVIHFDQYDLSSCMAAFAQAIQKSPDGVIFPPFFREESLAFTRQLNELKIPFVFLDSLIPDTNALSYFGQDSYRSGEIAAKLLMSITEKDSSIALFHTYRTGDLGSNQTEEREKGFVDYIKKFCPGAKLYPIRLSSTAHDKNISLIEKSLVENADTKGAVIFNSLSHVVTGYLRDINRADINIIGYDTLERNKASLLRNEINFLIAQRPDQQGYLAVRALSEAILFNSQPKPLNYMPIDIIIRENVEFANQG